MKLFNLLMSIVVSLSFSSFASATPQTPMLSGESFVRILSYPNDLFLAQSCRVALSNTVNCNSIGKGYYSYSKLDALQRSNKSSAIAKTAGAVLVIGTVALTTIFSGAVLAVGAAVVVESIVGVGVVPGIVFKVIWTVGPTLVGAGIAKLSGLSPIQNYETASELGELQAQIRNNQITIGAAEMEHLLVLLEPAAPFGSANLNIQSSVVP